MNKTVNETLNKLVAYALDNLMLDSLDTTYVLNRLAALVGFDAPTANSDADYGDATLDALLNELAAATAQFDKQAALDILLPLPHTVNCRFDDLQGKTPDKAFEFLFDIYSRGGSVAPGPAIGADGYISYPGSGSSIRSVMLNVGDDLAYTPKAVANRVATLENPDILIEDIYSREAEFVGTYGGVIAARIGDSADYLCCAATPLTTATVKKQLATGTVKIALLDYPVPVLAFSGIAKNTVIRETAKTVKAAADAGMPIIAAAAATDGGITLYAVFANAVSPANSLFNAADALTACGVFATVDFAPLLPVLEKGTALSTDLADFKPVYDVIGGVKHGANAAAELGKAVTAMFKPALAAAAGADETAVCAMVEQK